MGKQFFISTAAIAVSESIEFVKSRKKNVGNNRLLKLIQLFSILVKNQSLGNLLLDTLDFRMLFKCLDQLYSQSIKVTDHIKFIVIQISKNT